jgi:hypothetical protein
MIETIDDIVGDIRAQNQGLPEDGYALSPLVCDLLGVADRIAKAIEVERNEWRKMLKGAKDAIEVLEKRCDAFEQCQTEETEGEVADGD